jgi:formiminoglutamase
MAYFGDGLYPKSVFKKPECQVVIFRVFQVFKPADVVEIFFSRHPTGAGDHTFTPNPAPMVVQLHSGVEPVLIKLRPNANSTFGKELHFTGNYGFGWCMLQCGMHPLQSLWNHFVIGIHSGYQFPLCIGQTCAVGINKTIALVGDHPKTVVKEGVYRGGLQRIVFAVVVDKDAFPVCKGLFGDTVQAFIKPPGSIFYGNNNGNSCGQVVKIHKFSVLKILHHRHLFICFFFARLPVVFLCRAMLEGFFEAVPESVWAPFRENESLVGGKLSIHNGKFPKLKKTRVAIIGIGDQANAFRKEFYAMQWRFEKLEVVDLGNLVEIKNEKDRQFALSEAMVELLESNITVLIIGNAPAYIYGQYKGYRQTGQQVEIVKVSPDIDLEEGSPLRQLLVEKPSYLFNIDFIGTQAYYVSNQTSAVLEKMYFENHRLGEVRNNIEETEPILRSAHMMMFDMNAVRASDAPGTKLQSPNGLYAEEAARLARYAGISNKLTSAYLYGLDPKTKDRQSFVLMAQMAWYFVDGVTARFNDHPEPEHKDFLIYRNRLQSTGHEVVFYKSRKSNRWWMEIPHPYEKQSFFIGCSYRDYQQVSEDEMPDRWWRAYQRLM